MGAGGMMLRFLRKVAGSAVARPPCACHPADEPDGVRDDPTQEREGDRASRFTCDETDACLQPDHRKQAGG
jgi:hypothetical protein